MWIEKLQQGDGSDVFVTPPVGATEPRPLVVAVHGAQDNPDWACSEWRTVVDAHAFVVCPRGAPYLGAYVWTSVDQLDSRVMAAIALVRATYGAYVDPGPVVYAGFSQGASLGPYVVARHPQLFTAVALEEGGYASASAAPALKRALLSCSTGVCDTAFAEAARSLARGGTDVHVVKLGPFGHTMDGHVMMALAQQWKWLVQGDARWSAWLAAH